MHEIFLMHKSLKAEIFFNILNISVTVCHKNVQSNVPVRHIQLSDIAICKLKEGIDHSDINSNHTIKRLALC